MTTVAPPKRSDMDLLRADDQMDLASSPAMQTEDVEFDLDDVREASAEPSHDLMLQDELEQATADSDPMRSTTADHVDDDLMLDEDTVIHHEDQSEIPEMNMQNQEYEDVHTDQDDDILYEDEEQPQDQDGFPSASLKEQQMEDELRAREHQLTEEVQIGEDVEVEVEVKTEGDTNLVAGESVQEAGEINDPSEPLQSVTAATLAESGEGAEAAPEMAANFIQEQHTPAKSLEDIAENAILGQGAKGKRDEADLNVEPNENLDSNEGAINDSDVDGFKAISGLPAPEASASDTGANLLTNIKQGSVRQPSLSPVLPIVKVHYQGTEMDLFHLSHDEAAAVYFLGDVKLAQESLDKMLGACREVLVDSIGEDDELVLDIASLGLHISEGSRYATQLTLSQILDVYVALAHNENATIIEPLHCTLTSRVCLASQYAYLQSAANEGRTFTQILEENAFEPGDDHENVFENAETEVHDQHVLAEITDAIKPGDNKQEEDAGSESQDGAPKPEYLDTEADSAEGDHSQTLEQQQQQIPGHGLDVTGRLVKEAETRGDEEHSASTAKGDSHDLEGDYDLSPELCFKPDACLCPSCTNIKPDSHARLSSQHEYVTHPEDPLDETVQNTEDPEQVHPDGLADTNDGDEPDFESNIHDSASSRTLEAENNELEEDPNASYDHDQQSDNGYGEFDIQYDDGEEFELEEGVHQDATAETKDGEAVDAHPRHDHEELDLEHTVPSLGGDLVDNNGVNSRSHQGTKPNEGSHDVTQPEDDDDLLNFDDGDAENGEEEQDQNAAFANHPTEVPSSENNNKDATKARQNGASHWENDSSLGALGPNRAESPVRKSISNMSTMPAEDAPSTPSGGKNGSKRKVFEDDEEFDLLDTATPEKKRRRPSP